MSASHLTHRKSAALRAKSLCAERRFPAASGKSTMIGRHFDFCRIEDWA